MPSMDATTWAPSTASMATLLAEATRPLMSPLPPISTELMRHNEASLVSKADSCTATEGVDGPGLLDHLVGAIARHYRERLRHCPADIDALPTMLARDVRFANEGGANDYC